MDEHEVICSGYQPELGVIVEFDRPTVVPETQIHRQFLIRIAVNQDLGNTCGQQLEGRCTLTTIGELVGATSQQCLDVTPGSRAQ